jgi:thiol-disulfide isomerase/thioredoxin
LPRDVTKTGDDAKDHATRLENHRELAALTGRLSEVCNMFAHSGMFPATADHSIEKEDKNKISGSWNFYRNVPPNAADIWQESCWLRFLAMLHESEIDFDRLAQVCEYADQVAEFESLQRLHVTMKRVWYAKTLTRIERFAARETVPCDSRLNEHNAGSSALAEAIRNFQPFFQRHLNVEHIDLAERFVAVAGVCPSEGISALLHELVDFDLPQNSNVELVERFDLLKGLLRQQELLGKPMPIWGVDLAGNVFDESKLDDMLKGKVVLLDFWATWCTPCVAEFPNLKILYEKYYDRGFEIIGYNVDSDLEQLSVFFERRPRPWPVLVREKSLVQDKPPLSTYYGARKLPVVLLRDRDGNVVLLDARGSELEKMLERLFEKP